MRLFVKYDEKYHRSIIKVAFLAKKYLFRCNILPFSTLLR